MQMPYKNYEDKIENSKKYYETIRKQRRIDYVKNGKCIVCGKENERSEQSTHCLSCSQKNTKYVKEKREFCKSLGICPGCSKNKLFGDEKRCPECRAKNANYKQKQRDSNREKEREYMKQYSKINYQKRKELGICTRCGKRNADNGKFTCLICRAKTNSKRINKSKRKTWIANDLCFRCGDVRKDGYKLCEKCYQQNLDASHSEKAVVARQSMSNGFRRNKI